MYRFTLKASRNKPVPKDVEFYMDELINNPFVIFPNTEISWKLGLFCKELRRRKILHISSDERLKEPIGILKINNAIRPNSVVKHKSKTIDYIFSDTLLPKIKEMDIY